MSDQTLSRARGDGVHNTVHTYTAVPVCVNTGVNTIATDATQCLIGHRERGARAL